MRKGLHKLLPVPSCANLFAERITPIAPSSFLCQSVSAKTYTNRNKFHLVPVCFRKDLHQLLPIVLVPICCGKTYTYCSPAPFLLVPISLEKCLHQLFPVPACANLPICLRKLMLPVPACADFFLLKAYTICALCFLPVQIWFPQAYTMKVSCVCQSVSANITFNFLSLSA